MFTGQSNAASNKISVNAVMEKMILRLPKDVRDLYRSIGSMPTDCGFISEYNVEQLLGPSGYIENSDQHESNEDCVYDSPLAFAAMYGSNEVILAIIRALGKSACTHLCSEVMIGEGNFPIYYLILSPDENSVRFDSESILIPFFELIGDIEAGNLLSRDRYVFIEKMCDVAWRDLGGMLRLIRILGEKAGESFLLIDDDEGCSVISRALKSGHSDSTAILSHMIMQTGMSNNDPFDIKECDQEKKNKLNEAISLAVKMLQDELLKGKKLTRQQELLCVRGGEIAEENYLRNKDAKHQLQYELGSSALWVQFLSEKEKVLVSPATSNKRDRPDEDSGDHRSNMKPRI